MHTGAGALLPTSARATWAAWLRLGAWPLLWPLAALNALLTLDSDGRSLWPHPALRVSLELAVVVLALALWSVWRRPPRLARWLAIVTTLGVLAHALNVAARTVYGRPLNLYWDGRHVRDLLQMDAGGSPPVWRMVLVAVALLVVLALVGLTVRHLWRRLLPRLEDARARTVLIAGCAALLVGFAVHEVRGHDLRRMFSHPVAPELARQGRLLANQLSAERTAALLTPSPDFGGNLGALHGADVLLLFAGPYGITPFEQPRRAWALAPTRDALPATIDANGRTVVSARVTSANLGGGAWLAHAAVLTGVDTHDPLDHDVLLTTQRPTLVQHFHRHGWRTVGWMPGLHKAWPEGRFYGFDRIADLQGIGYGGAAPGDWRVPDQAAMALLHAQELAVPRSARAPVFAVFPTTAGHASFRWLADYLTHRAPAGLLTIVIDDQPRAAVSGASGASGAWDVPVHVIGGDPVLIERFVQAGFARGLVPPTERWGDMHQLTAMLLDVFADGRPNDSAAAAK